MPAMTEPLGLVRKRRGPVARSWRGDGDPSEGEFAGVVQLTERSRARTFEAFFEEHHGDLFAAMWLVTRNRHETEEITQDAFLRMWERWDRMGHVDDPEGYLYRIAMNVFRSRLRRARVAARRAVGQVPPDDAIAAVEEREALVRTLAPLTARQRAAVVLTDVLGFPSEEAARILGVRAVTVRVLAKRARDRLRQEIGGRDASGP
jgi:RNA polymerase sigma-70 factor (ECF subfamily)